MRLCRSVSVSLRPFRLEVSFCPAEPAKRYALVEMRTTSLFILLLLVMPSAYSRGTVVERARTATSARSSKCTGCARNSKGRITRSPQEKRDFQKTSPVPRNGGHFRWLQRLCCRSHRSAEAGWRGQPGQYAVADEGRGQRERQNRISATACSVSNDVRSRSTPQNGRRLNIY